WRIAASRSPTGCAPDAAPATRNHIVCGLPAGTSTQRRPTPPLATTAWSARLVGVNRRRAPATPSARHPSGDLMADPSTRLHTDAGATLPLLGWASRHRLDPHHIAAVDPQGCLPGKPCGGLWTSPILGRRRPPTATAWTRWCRTEASHRRPTCL